LQDPAQRILLYKKNHNKNHYQQPARLLPGLWDRVVESINDLSLKLDEGGFDEFYEEDY